MRNTRSLIIVAAPFVAGLLGASCESSDNGQGAQDVCGAVGGYVPVCDEATTCEAAIQRDCGPLERALASTYAQSFNDCMLGLGDPMGCLDSALAQTPSSEGLSEFATTLCLECGDGAGECEDEVLLGAAGSDLARAGRIARTLSQPVLEEVIDECATGGDCAAEFYDCAVGIISRSIPDETASCLASAVVDGAPDEIDCSAADSSGDDDDDATGTGGMDADDGDDDDDDDDDDMMDTGGPCTYAGCACEFTEDCDAGLTCTGDICVEPTECGEDPNEPNEDEATATVLPPIGDDDGRAAQITGLLDHPTDIDWFSYDGSDNIGSLVNPSAQLNVFALELCIYAECANGLENTDLSCNEGTTQTPSAGGRPGCCGANTGGFEVNLSCTSNPFGSDDATIYMSVTGSESGICQEFTLGYHY